MFKKFLIIFLFPLLILITMTGCLEKMVKPSAKTDTGEEMQLPPYSGPRAKIAVAKFEWKVDQNKGGSTTKISGLGGLSPITISHSENTGYMTGLRDMLTTAMVQSKRFRVLERQNLDSLKDEMALSNEGYADQSGVKKGGIKGADLLIVAAITGWEPASSGKGGKLGGGILGKAGAAFGAIGGATKKSSMAMDIRVIDSHTSEVLAATRIEGEAKNVNIGGALAGLTGGGGMGGGLSAHAKTPMEKAIRTCIYNAVKFMVDNTPQEYMKH